MSAHAAALRLLATRELSCRQLQERLQKRGFADDEIAATVARLRADGSLDDRRVALAYARTAAQVKHRGRGRVLKELETLGIARGLAREAADEVFGDLDEAALVERLLSRRLRGRIGSKADFARHYRYLLRQGYSAAVVFAALKRRSASTLAIDEAS